MLTEAGVTLQLFGGFAVRATEPHGGPVTLRRGQAMLAYLAVKTARAESREVLLDLLWPDRFKPQAQASLRQVLFELRDTAMVDSTRSTVSLGAAVAGCDVWDFEQLAGAHELAAAERMLQLYRGPLLDGVAIRAEPFLQWLAAQRARFEGLLEATALRAAGAAPPDHAGRAAGLLERLIEINPMCCQAVARLMELEAARGRAPEALALYERYARRLRLEFDEVPPPELEAACAGLKAATRRIVPAPALRRPAYVHRDPWLKTRADAPVLAVLPFRSAGLDAPGQALAMALTEDITMMLSGCRWFSVLSRSATHSLGDDGPFIPKDFARLTGTDYLVYGALAERQGQLSLGIELADAETGQIRWAKRYDAAAAEPQSWASEICPLIVAAIDPAVAASEDRALRRPALAATGSAVAYQHLVEGYRHYYAGDIAPALMAFDAAIHEDATYAHAHAMRAITIYIAGQIERDERWGAALAAAETSARRALQIDPSEPKASIVLGQVLDWQGRHDEATAFLDGAIALNPSFAFASTARSYHAVMVGAFDTAKEFLRVAMRLRVGDGGMGLCLPSKALADLHLGNCDDALATAHWAVRLRPRFWLGRQVLAACLSSCGRDAEARRQTAALQRDYASLSADAFANWVPYAHPEDAAPVADALRRAGWR